MCVCMYIYTPRCAASMCARVHAHTLTGSPFPVRLRGGEHRSQYKHKHGDQFRIS